MRFEKKNIGQYVEKILRRKIMLLELPEGEHLKETILAEEMSISRGPIREAIKKLEYEGLVKTLGNGRTVVSKFDFAYTENLYKIRILLETYAVKNLNPSLLEEQGEFLYTYLNLMQQNLDDNEMYREADLSFHQHIIKMSGNQTLIQSWLSLKDLIITLIEVTTEATKDRNQDIVLEHKKIVEAIMEKDFDKASQMLEKHLTGAAKYYSNAIFKLQNEEE